MVSDQDPAAIGTVASGSCCQASADAAALAQGKALFDRPCAFVTGAVSAAGMPTDDRLEVCFVGRSNVGKSSLLNALTNRRRLARFSTSPGRTREVNFFALGDTHYLVDLPGYGHARMSKSMIRSCQALMRSYLLGRAPLRRAFLLIDSRHGAKPLDREFMSILQLAGVSFQIVLTKADKIRLADRPSLHRIVEGDIAAHPGARPDVCVTSSSRRFGIDTIRASIAELT